jgi:DNA-binding IscR family transcriptional regulator
MIGGCFVGLSSWRGIIESTHANRTPSIESSKGGKTPFGEIPKASVKNSEFLVQMLKRSHYLKAKRGLNGGYSLARDPGQISVAEIVRLMDGPLAPTESASVFFFENTPVGQESKLIEEFREIRNFVSMKLEGLRLSDLL